MNMTSSHAVEKSLYPLRLLAAALGIHVSGPQHGRRLIIGDWTLWDGMPAVVGLVVGEWWN